MKTLYIIRGLPGSGKTTLAKKLAGTNVCEADNYFTNDREEYNFDASKLSEAHYHCKVMCRLLMEEQEENIAVSNTSSMRWEFAEYVAMAQEHGYRIVEITLTGDTYANTHNVPESTIEAMKTRWEL